MTHASERSEQLAKRAIEDRGFKVHDANIIFTQNCPNIDLIVYGKTGACYVQVKSSTKPSGKNALVVGGQWSQEQLDGAPIYNQRADEMQASLVVVVDNKPDGGADFYIAPPATLERLLRPRAVAFANFPKRDGTKRKMFRMELTKDVLAPWLNAWHLLADRVADRVAS